MNMTPEQQADLAALQAGAAETELPPMDGGEPLPEIDPAESWAVLPAMLGSVLSIAMPEIRAVYTPEACRAWGEAMIPVADKYGWESNSLMGPEVALIAASLPFIVGTVGAINAKKAKLAKEAKVENRVDVRQDATPSPKTVVIGSPVVA